MFESPSVAFFRFVFRKTVFVFCLFFLLTSAFFPLFAAEDVPFELKEVGVDEKLGGFVSPLLSFKNEDGKEVKIEELLNRNKPIILNLVYYSCPNLCNLLLNGFLTTLKSFEWSVGKEFEVLTVSIDSRETSDLASKKKQSYLDEYKRVGANSGWHFWVGEEREIRTLAAQVGFKYKYDERQKQFAHTAVLILLTPEGKISRYLYGIEFAPKDLKFALVEAGKGETGSVLDRLIMFCYRYDPQGKRYAFYATQAMKIAAFVSVVLLVGSVLILSMRKRNFPSGRS